MIWRLAGPVIALQLIPATAAIGMSLEMGEGAIALHALGRLGIDVGMVLLACLLVFGYKHVFVHDGREAWN